MSKKPDKSERKLSKKEQRRLQLEREKRMRTLRLAIPGAAVLVALIVLVIVRFNRPEVEGVVVAEAATANQHDDSLHIDFGGLPPTGGPHNSAWQNCGIYIDPVLPEYAIHSMEHGAVWVSYHPDLPADQISALQDEVRGQSYILLSPFPDQSSPIVLSAWDRQLAVDSASDARIGQFIDQYRRTRGPESGAVCSGGVGTPIN